MDRLTRRVKSSTGNGTDGAAIQKRLIDFPSLVGTLERNLRATRFLAAGRRPQRDFPPFPRRPCATVWLSPAPGLGSTYVAWSKMCADANCSGVA